MNPTVAVALISAVSTGGLGVFATYLSWKTGRRASDIELRRIDSEERRTVLVHAEAERQRRQSSYHELVVHMMHLNSIGAGVVPADEQIAAEWEAKFWDLTATLTLLGTADVIAALEVLETVFNAFTSQVHANADGRALPSLHPDEWWNCFLPAWIRHHADFQEAFASLTSAMRKDINVLGAEPPPEIATAAV